MLLKVVRIKPDRIRCSRNRKARSATLGRSPSNVPRGTLTRLGPRSAPVTSKPWGTASMFHVEHSFPFPRPAILRWSPDAHRQECV